MSEAFARDELLDPQPRGPEDQAKRAELLSIELTKQRVKRARDHELLAADGRVRRRRHPAHRRAPGDREGDVPTSAGRRCSGEASEAITQGAQFSDALARNADAVPAVLPRDHPGRGDDRPARPRARAALELPGARSRDAQPHQPGARVPDGRARHGRRHGRRAGGLGAAEVRDVLQAASARSCRCRPACSSALANFTKHFWWVYRR